MSIRKRYRLEKIVAIGNSRRRSTVQKVPADRECQNDGPHDQYDSKKSINCFHAKHASPGGFGFGLQVLCELLALPWSSQIQVARGQNDG